MRLDWTDLAREDLREINIWLAREVSPALAIRILAAIRHRSTILEDFPRSGRPHRDGARILRVYETPYLLRYRIIDEAVQILRVHHERENWHVEP